jgi:hypothetical protein
VLVALFNYLNQINMRLMTVNEDANYIVQLFVAEKWQTLTEEYSATAASIVMTNASILTGLEARFCSKRSNNMVIGYHDHKNKSYSKIKEQ